MCVCVCVCVESQPRKLYSAGSIGENSNLILFFSGTFVIRLCVHTYSAINQKEIVELRPLNKYISIQLFGFHSDIESANIVGYSVICDFILEFKLSLSFVDVK
jgi:hypothetical protein